MNPSNASVEIKPYFNAICTGPVWLATTGQDYYGTALKRSGVGFSSYTGLPERFKALQDYTLPPIIEVGKLQGDDLIPLDVSNILGGQPVLMLALLVSLGKSVNATPCGIVLGGENHREARLSFKQEAQADLFREAFDNSLLFDRGGLWRAKTDKQRNTMIHACAGHPDADFICDDLQVWGITGQTEIPREPLQVNKVLTTCEMAQNIACPLPIDGVV